MAPSGLRGHVQPCWYTYGYPMFGDFPACLTHSRHPPVERVPLSLHSALSCFGEHCGLRPCSLRMGISLPSLPPFLPPGTRGVLVPRAWRSRPGMELDVAEYPHEKSLGKASLAGFIVNQELKKRISRKNAPVLGSWDRFWPGGPPGAPLGPQGGPCLLYTSPSPRD